MPRGARDIAWNLFTDLRKELVELQKIRSQVTGFKITFVSAAIGLIAANLDKVSGLLFVIPGFAAVFFDMLIHSYSFSIKRTGYYCREYLEPILKAEHKLPREHLLWEQFIAIPQAGKNVSLWGNLGITILAAVPAIVVLLKPFNFIVSFPLLLCLLGLLIYDAVVLYKPFVFATQRSGFVYNPDPEPGVAVLILRGNEVLLARRRFEPAKGQWDIPGGFVEPGESAEDAAVREAREETSLEIQLTGYLGSVPDVYGDNKLPTLNLCFTAEVVSGKEQAQSDVESLKWFPVDNLPTNMAFEHQHKLLRLVREYVNKKSRQA